MDEVSKNTTDKEETREKKKVKHKKKKLISLWGIITTMLFLIIVLLLVGDTYLWKAQYFLEHFYENTVVNGMDCSDLQVDEVKAMIQDSVDDYQIVIHTLEGESYTITGPEIELKYVDDNAVDVLIKSQKPLLWIQKNSESANHEIVPDTWHNEELLKEIVQQLPFMDKEQMTQPQDAYVSDTEEGYVIVPEVEGNALDETKVLEVLNNAISFGKKAISLTTEECYLKPQVYRDSEALINAAETLNQLTQANISYTVCDEEYVIDREVLKNWLIQDEEGEYLIDNAKMEEFIQKLAGERDTYGGTRKFKTNAGKTITLKTNEYGWKVNQEKSVEELKNAIIDGFQGEMELIYDHTAQGTGADDLGNTYIEISISAQKLWYYKDGKVQIKTDIVSGNIAKNYATPKNGCWSVYSKETNYTIVSPEMVNGKPKFTEPTKYWLAFNDAIGIYDKARDKFGGTVYKNHGSYSGSIQIPQKIAKTFYTAVEIGTPVIVY